MATTVYRVELPVNKPGFTPLENGKNAVLVRANTVAEAKAAAKAAFNFDVDTVWDFAVVTAVAETVDWFSPSVWGFRIVITHPTTGAEVVNVTVYSDATNNTVDEIAALLVTALNATTPIAGAAYNSTSQVLTIAQTTDSLGDHQVALFSWPVINGNTERNTLQIGAFFGVLVDGGAAGSALSVTLASDAPVAGTGVLTFAANPTAAETVTIGDRVYTFRAALTPTQNEILIGATQDDSLNNLTAAINGSAGAGTLYAAGTAPNQYVSGVADTGANTLTVTARDKGLLPIATTETGATSMSWGAATLTGGAAGAAPPAVIMGYRQ